MKRKALVVFLFFILLVMALILSAAHQVRQDEVTTIPTLWRLLQITPDSVLPTLTPGWWRNIPSAIPFPTPTLSSIGR
jgi:hypothetical protein